MSTPLDDDQIRDYEMTAVDAAALMIQGTRGYILATHAVPDLIAEVRRLHKERAAAEAKVERSWRREIERALREADCTEDSMATDEDITRYEGRREAVRIMRDMLQLDAAPRTDAKQARECLTCNGWNPVTGLRRRETVGMVCQTCGWDYARDGEPDAAPRTDGEGA